MIVIKINEVPNSKEGLMERTRRAWRINPARLYNQDSLISVYKGEVLEEYRIKGYKPDTEFPDRVAFDLEEVPNSPLKGQKIDYRTSNPCTIINPEEFGLGVKKAHSAVLYTIPRYFKQKDFYIMPVSKDLDDGVQVTTWKYEDDQSFFNFELKFPLEYAAKNEIHYEEKSHFLGDYNDQIAEITEVVVTDGFIVIGGFKEKANERE